MANKGRQFIVLVLSAIVVCCQSTPKSSVVKQLAFPDLEKLSIGTAQAGVIQILGRPAKEVSTNGEIIWSYPDPSSGDDRVILTINPDGRNLAFKLIIPFSNEPEANLDFVLKEKFKGYDFVRLTFPQCGHDFVSDEVLYVDITHAVLVRSSKTSGRVLGISWTDKLTAENTIRNVKNCNHR